MVAISKEIFDSKVDPSVRCNVIHYWDRDCLKAGLAPQWSLNLALGTGKFFLPIYLLKLVLNYKKVNRKFLLGLLLSELRSICYGLAMGHILIISMCILRKLLGRIYYPTAVFIPGMLSGLSLLVETRENQTLDLLIFFNSFVETILMKINLTSTLQTVLFMTASALLMHIFENSKEKINFFYLWFYTPSVPNKEDKTDEVKCRHSSNCVKYISEGTKRYFALGYGFNIIRTFLSKSKVLLKKQSMLLNILFNWDNCKFGLFLGSYVALYRAITCYSTTSLKIPPNRTGFYAGLVSGLTYTIFPKVQILITAITTLGQLFYHYLATRYNITNHFWQKQLLFMFCHGYLIHNMFCYPDTCSPYYSNMIAGCTNNVSKVMYLHLMKQFF